MPVRPAPERPAPAHGDPAGAPRRFGSLGELLGDAGGVVRRAGPLAEVYLRRRLEPELRELVMVAVARANACGGCTFVHERWAAEAGVSDEELAAIGLDDLAALDPRTRAAVIFARARAESRFREPVPDEIAACASERLTPAELEAVEAVARMMAFANLTVNTAEALRPGRS